MWYLYRHHRLQGFTMDQRLPNIQGDGDTACTTQTPLDHTHRDRGTIGRVTTTVLIRSIALWFGAHRRYNYSSSQEITLTHAVHGRKQGKD